MVRLSTKLFLLFAVFSLLLSGNVLAENRRAAATVTPMIGYHIIDGGMDLDDHAAFGLALGYNITERWAIEGDVRYTPTQTDLQGVKDIDVDIWTLGLGALYHFQPKEVLNPYLSVGLGGMIYDPDKGSDNGDYMAYWGGGVKYALNDTAALRVDLRHILNYQSDAEFSTGDNTNWRHHLQAMLGLSFQFGGVSGVPFQVTREAEPVVEEKPQPQPAPAPAPAPVAAVPVDSDGDGVLDDQDKCPGTSPGVRVDPDGCPSDTDGDGVADYRDACVDTPKGVKVDTRGCPDDVEPVAELTLQINFGVDKDTVTPFHYRELEKAVSFINKYPEHRIEVEGHTDSTGPAAHNQDLSKRRAENVRMVLIERYGIAADRISARGFGMEKPMTSNETVEGRQQNRRVEIEILP